MLKDCFSGGSCNRRRRIRGVAQVMGAMALTSAAFMPVAQAKRATPTVAQILDDYIAATGGRAAYDKIKSSEVSGTLELVAQKIKGSIEVKQKAPDKFYTAQTIAGIGKLEQGYDGKTAWARDPINGGRILAGAELAQAQLQARLNSTLQWKQLYPKAELLGERTVAGARAYAVRLTPVNGRPTTQFYDIKTKLMVRQDQTADSPQGAVPTESYFSDYKTVDGVKAPFAMRLVQAGTEITVKMTSIKNNVTIPDSVFAVPADIKPGASK